MKGYHDDIDDIYEEHDKFSNKNMFSHKCKRMKNKRKMKNMLRWAKNVY